ncbi:hypothetical protein F2Q69_00003439 [Brassica cretica]|uniref:Uncharacterized protein n=1 Tax=Brassica cretica TaxID=69181 RepID=A0A8S9PE60_BRACR|nr:hypothetical protein F2Q69_00003439 [Brassica cretica]
MKNYIIADNNIYTFQGNENKEHSFEIQLLAPVNEILATGDDASEPSKIPQACADVGLKRMGDGVEKGNPKHSKDGN